MTHKYFVQGNQTLYYQIGDTVVTFNGIEGVAVERFKLSKCMPIMLRLRVGNEEVCVPEHHVRKVLKAK